MNDQVDMSQFVEAKSDQLNADDLIGTTRTITVRKVTGESGDQPVSIYYEGDNNKPFKPCKTMRRVLLAVWGKFAANYVGRSMTIYRDDAVTFGGLATGGVRISHMSHLEKETVVVVLAKKGKKVGVKVLPLADAPKQSGGGSPAQRFTTAYKAKVEECADLEALNAFANTKATKLAELQSASPELHTECVHALDMRREALTVDQEGKPDADTGEAFGEDGGFADE